MPGYKKTVMAVLCLSSSLTFAGEMGMTCLAANTTVPCDDFGWSVGAQALYLEHDIGGGVIPAYLVIDGINIYPSTTNKWGWGFEVEGMYKFSTGNDASIAWYHMENSRSFSLPDSLVFAPSITTAGISYASHKPHWDAVNVELAQHLDFSAQSSARFYGGAEAVTLGEQITATGFIVPTLAMTYVQKFRFNGLGPRIGADLAYNFGNRFSLYSKSAVGIYAGNMKRNVVSSLDLSNSGTRLSTTIVVPELEGKLGAQYTQPLAYGDISVDAGWMMINYMGTLLVTSGNVVHAENFALQGPYVGFKWIGAGMM